MDLRHIIAIVVVIGLAGGVYYFGYMQGEPKAAIENSATTTGQQSEQKAAAPEEEKILADVGYLCDGGKTVHAVYFEGKLIIELSDGRAAQLHSTVTGSGARYATKDESLVFWSKGPTAFVEEAGEVAYANCIELDTEGVEVQ